MSSSFKSRLVASLSVTLALAACGGGGSGDVGGGVINPAPTGVSVSGKLTLEFAPTKASCNGLDLDNPELRDMRGVTVQLLDASNNVLGETTSRSDGSYTFTNIATNTSVRVRARAELKSSGPAAWDVEVRDNVDTSANPAPLTQRPLYVTQWPSFNTGTANVTGADFTATTGWDGNAYSGNRTAAPFAILYSIMDAMETITAVDPTATFPPLDVYWSVNNTLATGASDIDTGQLSTTFYSNGGLYMLGDAGLDTDEFDETISIHEWAHYFEDFFSRSDSLGGAHRIGEPLDPRLAFGEGFASAMAMIALERPIYCDTNAPIESGGFGYNFETFNGGLQGWFNEASVITFLWDLWDTDPDGTDDSSIGFAPIYNTMVGPQANAEAFTTLFSFAAGLRPMLSPTERAFVDSQLNRENVDTPAVVNIWGDGQTTQPTNSSYPNGRDIADPVYGELLTNGSALNICTNNDYQVPDEPNKLGDRRYMRFETTSSSAWTITATANPAPPPTTDRSDPDLYLHRGGERFPFEGGLSATGDQEVFVTSVLPAGTYMLLLEEWRFNDDNAASNFPSQVCFEITMVPR